MELRDIIGFYDTLPFRFESGSGQTHLLKGLSGSAQALMVARMFSEHKGQHVIFIEDKEEAAYFYNDLTALLTDKSVFFFPSSYKRSIRYGQTEAADIILRTEALKALHSRRQALVVTYPEAVIETVIKPDELEEKTLELHKGEQVDKSFIQQLLDELQFERVDFVYEPGQYAVRGGIIDIFSFAHENPYRIDFWGNEVDSIRTFDTETQLSIAVCEELTIVPDIRSGLSQQKKITLLDFIKQKTTLWFNQVDVFCQRLDEIRTSVKEARDAAEGAMENVIDTGSFKSSLEGFDLFILGNSPFGKDNIQVDYNFTPQPFFHKNFDLLFDDLKQKKTDGYKIFILSNSDKQIERLRAIFEDQEKDIEFEAIKPTVHQGFIDNEKKLCFYTDHQIFDRYHKFKLKSDRLRTNKASLTLKEINQLNPGDYVVHTDHGIGRFDGLTRTEINGKMQEVIKISYRDSDVLFVSIHSLHRISKYKSKDASQPSVNKLGTGAWQRLKQKTKSRVKDIARDLIKLYAKRREESGFAFSPDSFMQNELEASFIYEDTPDQLKSTQAIKNDMEQSIPMDRLVCGDVGFGKTEVAIRAAFKAATDNKQVAVLVPTTILAFQHYNTFNERLREFPVRVEYISRFRTSAEIKKILKDTSEGKVDILIGTHRLTSKDVQFKDLGLLIIDEEQKFGVSIKEKLKQMRVNVDTLTLTATPIPRTLQFSLMGARDLSIINTPPPNRFPILTEVHTFNEDIIREAIAYELDRDGQVFFIHNRIQNIKEVEMMIRRAVPDARTIIGHGQMDGKTLERVMLDFIAGEYDVLIATTIIESGLDIPNANTIIINDAQNYGLSDLHQLRGRVGRANKKAFAYILAPPVTTLPQEARRRLEAIENFSELGSGFQIALQDLDIRGAGNLLGAEQSGFIENIGLETYHKILNEAIRELATEEFSDLFANRQTEQFTSGFFTDCQVETDMALQFPTEYIDNTAERISLYRRLDNINTEEELGKFEKEVEDRFGKFPEEVLQLINVVRLRWMAQKLGIEKLVLRTGKMLAYFIPDQEDPYYKSDAFTGLLKYLQAHPKSCKMKEKNERLSLVFPEVKSIDTALKVLSPIIQSMNN
ncbi:transcription-repair coupling factor [Saccharicrinis sp. FJH54]|uniref:transcription-repair coupling factor n=1 Tax=Saccharicrinis sp. FJH54 TaxID=3344665 RepID=UPI0035D50975